MKLLGIWALWLGIYFGTMVAGDWYESYFHFFQAAASFLLMQVVLRYTDSWWRAEYATLCALHIFHNLGDYFLDFPANHYNSIQSILNVLELVVLFGAGGITELLRWRHGRNPSAGRRGSNNRQLAQGPQPRRGNV